MHCLVKIGDETFIIAALMAMRHPKSTVLSGALSALVVMTVGETAACRCSGCLSRQDWAAV
jgi:putative Ca2+/H+ antiporter (TMEM165/GDT1 family)